MCIKMSDVRLSNASPTLERVDARLQDNVRPPVRRNLFGRPDPAETRRSLENLVQEDVQAFRDNYNFDPVNDRPLSSRNYVWQEDPNPPDFYTRPPHRRPEREEDSPGESQREDAAERALQSGTNRTRKRHSGDLGSCSSECQGAKKSHTDEDDDDDGDDEDDRAGNQVLGDLQENGSSVVV